MFDSGVSSFELYSTGQLTPLEDIADDATLMLIGARDLNSVTIGGSTFLLVVSQGDTGVSVFEVGSDGTLTNVSNFIDDANSSFSTTQNVEIAQIGGSTFVYVAQIGTDLIDIFEMNNDGSLTWISNFQDAGTLELDGPYYMAMNEIGGVHYLSVTGQTDDGFSVLRVEADGSLSEVVSVTDDLNLKLNGGGATHVVGINGVP